MRIGDLAEDKEAQVLEDCFYRSNTVKNGE